MSRSAAVAAARLALLAGAVLALELLCRAGVIQPLTLIPPSAMAAALAGLLWSGELNADLIHTGGAVAASLALAVGLGLPLGVAVHGLPRLRRALDPLLAAYYAVPTFVFYPLLVAILGLNQAPLIVLGTAFGLPAMMMATLNGLDRVPPVLLRTARVHRLGRLDTLASIVLPSAAPFLFTGCKLALAYAVIGIIAGEFILADAGLGHAISFAYDGFENRTMYAVMLLVLGLATGLNLLLHLWETRLMRRRARA
ncbi:Bicarbonate transport system permease protein CmpB [Methylobacterium crusticola]|uniref:Bicarbonate transport system permease protein CmpB n=1 Tax=Methylobacterium crusticola TaxID=1697972 RepID=A0ABQ4R596_9HYPH|nr:ABC transporter permease subunit [Methylobacterium crusticola]GJD52875.1 Bicarbonate transport system permease protein CmpB [Methylobacterium crusticola]